MPGSWTPLPGIPRASTPMPSLSLPNSSKVHPRCTARSRGPSSAGCLIT